MNTRQIKIQNLLEQIKRVNQDIDGIVLQGGRVGLGDPLTRRLQTLRSQLTALRKR